ncbi:hypothetical protein BGZ58_010305 [Dissophora ornata]|nr:hypothetical protein BGZ58_010305 [Dissophora ornata]
MALHTALLWLARHNQASAIAASSDSVPPLQANLSNLAGTLSIICWFIVFTPQFWINYKRQSGESLSLTFLYIWLAGDLFNVVGATMDNLLLTMRILAWYYTLADTLLIAQVFYYRRVNRRKKELEALETGSEQEQHGHAPSLSSASDLASVLNDETTSLLSKTHIHKSANVYDSSSSIISNDKNYSAIEPTPSISSTMSFSKGPDLEQQQQQQRRRHCHLPIDPSAQRRLSTASEHTRTLPSRRRLRKLVLILLPILTATFFVLAYVEWRQRVLDNRGRDKGKGEEGMGGWLALFFGWGSALLYLGSRIPQLYKNWRLQSCEGLSIMMFTFSVLGNMLYVASIFLSSTDPDYLWRNMPWWLGSLGTLVFDISIFAQFFMYRNNKHPQDDEQD